MSILVQFSTVGVVAEQQAAAWQAEVNQHFGPADVLCGGKSSFLAGVQTASVGSLVLSDVWAEPMTIQRSRTHVEHRALDAFTIGMLLSGRGLVEQDGREAFIGPGDVVMLDCRRPYRIRFDSAFRQRIFQCDRQQLEARLPRVERCTAQRIVDALPSVTAEYLFGVAAHKPGSLAEGMVARHALDLLALMLGAKESGAEGSPHFLRVQLYIEEHLGDPLLSPARIAEHHQFSVRYLYRLFESEGESVAAYIRSRRLERCRAALIDEPARSISDIAFSFGFNDASHFGRAFREAFGVPPRLYRKRSAP